MADFSVTGTELYSQFIHLSRYARWLPEEGRRETWDETVSRYINFMRERFPDIDEETFSYLKEQIKTFNVMPSMRALMTAGKALERDNVAAFNCAFSIIDSPRAFDEICYCLLCGTGVGFSVERQYVNKLPEVAEEFFESDTVIVVPDSKIGWAKSFRELISLCYLGHIPKWDLSKLRPAGAPLKTFGGRSSGKWPLNDLFEFTVSLFKKAAGRKLSSLECHDLVCKIAEIVVVGGTRRCLPENSTVFTPSGPKYIQDVKAGDVVVTGGETGEIVASGPSGKKKTIVINHRFGSLECTPEHRVAVFNSIMKYEFKRASDVVEGDRLVWDTVGYDGVHTELPFFDEEFHFNAKEFRIPELDEEVAWLFGLIHGDGYVGSKGVEIAGNSKQISFLARASMIFETKFGVSAPYGPDGRAGAGTRLRANSSGLGRWFLKNLKKPNESIQIPDFIMNSTRSIRSAYLAGLLDADGRVRKQDECIDQACTIYESFASDLVTLLAGLGIAGFVSKISGSVKRSKGVNCKDAYNIQIRGNVNRKIFYDEVGLYSCKLRERTLGFSSSVDFSFPVRWAGGIEGYGPRGNITVTSMRYDLPLLPTRVVSIEEGQEVETYDIQVSGLERFTTNGLVVHNSALLSLSNLSDDRMRTAKSGQWWVEDKQRALANNSAAYTEKPEFDVFLKEWMSLYESKSGERGIFSRVAADKKVRSTGRREPGHEWGCNPCTSGDTLILTKDGNKKIEDCVGKEVEVWNGESFEKVVPFSTGVNDTLKIVFSNGVSLRATYYHEFVLSSGETVEAQDLIAGDMLYPFLLPDGRNQCAYVSLISEDDPCETFCFTEEKTGRGTFNGLVTKQCGEIILRPNEFCNLSEVIVRPDDTLESLKDKVKSATILGTFQSTLTDFRYLRKIWKKNVEEERLLGVSITGVMDHKVLGDYKNKDLPNWLSELRAVAVEENKKWAEKLGINQSVSVTTLKPSGTVSQVCNTSSGIHPRYSPYYVRTVRADGKDPLAQLMIDQGFPYEIDVMNDKNYVFSFPVKSPDHAKTTDDISAMDQLKLWLVYQEYWCEHNPSCTIYYRDDEFLELGSFVWNNFDKITGVSFLPHSDHVYKQAPYQPITKEEYEKLLEEFPQEVNWDVLGEYESEDNTAGSQTLACSGGVCEVVDLTEK